MIKGFYIREFYTKWKVSIYEIGTDNLAGALFYNDGILVASDFIENKEEIEKELYKYSRNGKLDGLLKNE